MCRTAGALAACRCSLKLLRILCSLTSPNSDNYRHFITSSLFCSAIVLYSAKYCGLSDLSAILNSRCSIAGCGSNNRIWHGALRSLACCMEHSQYYSLVAETFSNLALCIYALHKLGQPYPTERLEPPSRNRSPVLTRMWLSIAKGIDKADVRFVVHYTLSKALEARPRPTMSMPKAYPPPACCVQ